MTPVLREILRTGRVTNGTEFFPLKDNMDPEEGALITRAFGASKPSVSVEVGFAYGISALFACDALTANGGSVRHHVFDPFQMTDWHGVGAHNIKAAGYSDLVELHEVKSEIGLPQLLAAGTRIQAAIIDGWHTFDQTLVDFYYINKMLDNGGIVVIDDTRFPAVERCARHILTYPCYRLFGQVPDPSAFSRVGKIRRQSGRILPSLAREWDRPSAMAFEKVAPDDRNWDWHADF